MNSVTQTSVCDGTDALTASVTDSSLGHHDPRSLLAQAGALIEAKPFVPHPFFKHGDVQTIAAFLWPVRSRLRDVTGDEDRFFEVEPGTRVLARCRWQPNRAEHPTLLLWHGLEGSTMSGYMLRTADKAFGRGFNVLRVNIRNCGGTEHLTPTIYHGGMSGDLRAVVEELVARDRLTKLFIAGFSLGGNMVLKLAGEYGDDPLPEIKAICAISPSVDLTVGIEVLKRRRNVIYHKDFLYFLKRRMKLKARLNPGQYDVTGLNRIRTLEEFDNRYIAPAFGFSDAKDYYAKASSLPYIGRIRVPTLLIHAQDDPFVPFAPLTNPSISANPYVLFVGTEKGGHVAFISAGSQNEDRFWAENRLIDFCEVMRS